MKKIKTLFAIGRMSVGGAEKLLVHELIALDRSRFEPYLLTLFPETKESLAEEVALPLDHWRKECFASLADIGAWFRLIRFLKKEKFDAVITSLFSANFVVRVASLFARIPVVVSYEHNLYPDKRRWQIFADQYLARHTDRIIVDAETVKEFTSKQERIPKEKFLTLYIPPLTASGGRPKDEVMRELGLKPDYKIIATVSRLVPEKGHIYLIRAASEVLKVFPKTYFLLVGWGPLEAELKAEVERLGLKDRVLLPGRKNIQDILPLAYAYVEPATTVDIGIALMEAMRAGKPIVATAVGEMPVFIKENENGFLVTPGDAGALAKSIIELLKDTRKAERFGEASERIVEHYSFPRYMEQFQNLIIESHNAHAH